MPLPDHLPDHLRDHLRIRPARPDDAEALTHLHLDVWDDAYTGLVPQGILDDRRDQLESRVERWHRILTEDETPTWLAEADGGLIGFATAGPGRDNDVDTETELWALYVRQGWWCSGVGYALFETAVGERAAYVWVLAGNQRAIDFYTRQGFALDGTEDEHDEGLHVRMLRAGT